MLLFQNAPKIKKKIKIFSFPREAELMIYQEIQCGCPLFDENEHMVNLFLHVKSDDLKNINF